jgi:FKBP-type peptidyl-prolyl cis-trans isomerase
MMAVHALMTSAMSFSVGPTTGLQIYERQMYERAVSCMGETACDDLRRRNLFLQSLQVAAASALATTPCHAYDDTQFKSVSTQVGGSDFISSSTGLKYKDVRMGTGAIARQGDRVAVQFSGRCLNLNGKKFISTQDKDVLSTGLDVSQPYEFTIGVDKVIPGLQEAVTGMSKGGYRRVVIPAALGYDTDLTLGPTPGSFQELRSLEAIVKNPNRDASLLFDVTLERIKGN